MNSMSTAEMRKLILEKIEHLDDASLKKVQEFISTINAEPAEWNLREDVKEIVKEKSELLSKLAK